MTQEALKLALEALEEAWYHVGTFQPTEKAIDLYDEARAAIKEALREHAMREVQRLGQEIEQEPVAWEQFYPDIGKPQLTTPPQGIYYTPPQRTWVGLTEEEELQLAGMMDKSRHWLVAEVEAKLKEKNT